MLPLNRIDQGGQYGASGAIIFGPGVMIGGSGARIEGSEAKIWGSSANSWGFRVKIWRYLRPRFGCSGANIVGWGQAASILAQEPLILA